MSDAREHDGLSAFFSALAERAYKENDLSDVTYALLEANKAFRQFFLDFFFPQEELSGDHVAIEREHAVEEGRPDFWIRSGNEVYLVEVKIWDGGHHFEQYCEILKKEGSKDGRWARLGYIANYSLRDVYVCEDGTNKKASEVGCGLRTWEEFAKKLASCDCSDDLLVRGYLDYLKRVCPYDDFKVESWPGELRDFLSVKQFCESLPRAILRAERCKVYSSSRAASDRTRLGQFFEWSFNEKPVWGWLGVTYANKGAELCVEFEDREGWGRPVCEAVRQQRPSAVKDGVLRLYYEGKARFVEAVSRFLQETLAKIERGESASGLQEGGRAHEKDLLAMKAFPMRLDLLFREMEDLFRAPGNPPCAYDFVPTDARGQVKPQEFCGRYFELIPGDKDGRPFEREASKLRGWMGVLYSDGCTYANDGMPGAKEPLVKKEPVFMVELWGQCLMCVQANGWRKNSWDAACRIFEGLPTAAEIVDAIFTLISESRAGMAKQQP